MSNPATLLTPTVGVGVSAGAPQERVVPSRIGVGSSADREVVQGGEARVAFDGGRSYSPSRPSFGATYSGSRPSDMDSYGGTTGYGGSQAKVISGGIGTMSQAAPVATAAVDVNRDGRTDYLVTGVDRNRDGIPDSLQRQASPYGYSAGGGYRTVVPEESRERALARAYEDAKGDFNRSFIPESNSRTVSGLPTSGSFVAEPYARDGAPLYSSGRVTVTEPRDVGPRERYEYRSPSPLRGRSASPMYGGSYRDGGYADGAPVYRSRSPDTRGSVSYGSSVPYGSAPYAYGERGGNMSYGGPSMSSYPAGNYYSGSSRGYTDGDTYTGGAVSYGPSPGAYGGFGGYGARASQSYGFPTSGSFVAEAFAAGAPGPLPSTGSFVQPYGGGLPPMTSDIGYGTLPPVALPPPVPSSLSYVSPAIVPYGPSAMSLETRDLNAEMRQASNYYTAAPAFSNSTLLEKEEEAFAAGARAQANIDKEKESQAMPNVRPASATVNDTLPPQRRTKKRHGFGCC